MTEDGKARHLGTLHLDLQRARQGLGCLISQARQLQDSLKAVTRDAQLNEQVQIPQQVMDIRVGEFLTQIRETIVRIRQLESEIKNITPDFQPASLPSIKDSSSLV